MKIAIKYGFVIALVIALVTSFFVDLFGIEYEFVRSYSGFTPFLFLALGLFIAMRKTKKEVYKNEWNFGQAIYSGIVLSAFTALFLGIINFLYFQFINKNYAEKVIKLVVPLMEKDKLSADEIAKQLEAIRKTYIPINQLTGTFIFIMVAGVVFSAIYSSILRTKDTFTEIAKRKE
ncbi:MAG TPA: DUF4199 domain-containing protein [Cytophagaceae bacterium]|jgi:hypothetical protein|nr:DUF4199 domain-containing protein [Cytophagaceae bacterium]